MVEAQEEFGLYIQLVPGAVADLRAVATATLEMDALARLMASQINPMMQIEIGLKRGEEGSLDLITVIRDASAGDKAALRTLVFLLVLSTLGIAGANLVNDGVDLLQEWAKEKLSAEEAEEAERLARPVLDHASGAVHRRKMFEALLADEAITGVRGYSNPLRLNPPLTTRREIEEAVEALSEEETEDDLHRKVERRNITIIRPVLTASKAKWEFSLDGFRFSARIEDEQFISDLLRGRVEAPLRGGVVLDVDLASDVRVSGPVPEVFSRTVLKVHGVGHTD